MKAASRRTHVVIPPDLVAAIDSLVGKRGRSRFLVRAAERELQRAAQVRALSAAAGSWRDVDHPELKHGAAEWVRKLRSEDEGRLGRNPR